MEGPSKPTSSRAPDEGQSSQAGAYTTAPSFATASIQHIVEQAVAKVVAKAVHDVVTPLINNANQVTNIVNTLQKVTVNLVKITRVEFEKLTKYIAASFQACFATQNELKEEIQTLQHHVYRLERTLNELGIQAFSQPPASVSGPSTSAPPEMSPEFAPSDVAVEPITVVEPSIKTSFEPPAPSFEPSLSPPSSFKDDKGGE
ncbi:hypothetical protein K1719_042434 [Acacia pycnantha]|nr:hypothetical protein K1719_042434 [Acacia pycnantha]